VRKSRALTKDDKSLGKINCEKNFSEILVESVDEALLTLGENAKSSIYGYLENKFAISKQDIPKRIDGFSKALEEIFGMAARQIEILIMKCLNQRVDCSYVWVGPKWLVPDLTFTKYVILMRICCEETGKNSNIEVIFNGEAGQEQRI
jgi:hypothetical protein